MSANLFEAIEQHDLQQLAALLTLGSDPNVIQEREPGWRPLHAAIEELEHGASIEALVLLLRHAAVVDAWDAAQDATPLLMAIFRSQLEAVRMLLANGADPNVVGGEGDSPLRWSVEQEDHEMAAMLLRCGAGSTINGAGGPSGMTALGRAASRLNIPMIKLLLDFGADPEALDAEGHTARQHLPARDMDPQMWDAAMELLGHPLSAG